MAAVDRGIEVIRVEKPIRYRDAFRAQQHRRIAVERGEKGNALFLLEHPAVITIGRSGHAENILLSREELAARGIELHEVDRGGDVTYHGPGQLVAYPVLNLKLWKQSLRWYITSLEEIVIRTIASYGIKGEIMEGFTGVWVGGAKVAAIGIGVHAWVTFHGLALNVDPALSHFRLIVPCGIADKPVTSMRQLLGYAPPMTEVMDRLETEFLNYFANFKAE